MLDIKFIRENTKEVKKVCDNKQVKVDIDKLLKIDKERRNYLTKVEQISAEKNKSSKEISGLKDPKEKKKIISKMQKLDREGDKLKNKLKKLEKDYQCLMNQVPNLCLKCVPIGKDESANVVLKTKGKKPKFTFKPKDYMELVEKLDLIDVKRAAKTSGSRFGYLKNEVALMEIALINLAFDTLTKEGFVPVIPPVLIKPEAMRGMGYIDSKEDTDERYFLEKDGLFLVGTSEQSIGPMHMDEVLEDLPKRYVAFSTCFREEAGSYGKDTKGILRVHQFDKVEMFSFCRPEDSEKEHQFLLSMQEKLMQLLDLPYKVVQLCTGDMARPSASTIDIETWIPGQNVYRETHSTSNCTDFQSRRLNIKYRKDNKLEFVHTLNGTAFAIGRMIIAIIENNQQKDGGIKMPKALEKYLGFKVIK